MHAKGEVILGGRQDKGGIRSRAKGGKQREGGSGWVKGRGYDGGTGMIRGGKIGEGKGGNRDWLK